MKTSNLLLLFLGVLFCTACKKADSSDPDQMLSCPYPNRLSKVVAYYFSNNGIIDSVQFLLVYDESGRLTKRQWKNADTAPYEDYDYFEYDEQGNCTKHEWKTFTGSPSQYYEYDYVDKQRSVTRFFTSISPGAPTILMQTTRFFYDANQLVKIENDQPQFGNPPSVGTFSYSNGNKTVRLDYESSAGDIQTTFYHYNQLLNPTALLELRFAYPENELLLDSIQSTTTRDFQYQTDNAGRVLTKIAYLDELSDYAVIERYYYDCQE